MIFIDTIQHLADYEGHKLQSLTKEGLKFGDEDEEVLKKRSKTYKKQLKPLTKYLKKLFNGKVAKVTVSSRVEKSPAVIVTSQYGHTANMERIMRAQTLVSADSVKAMTAAKTLEINPRHPIIIELNKKIQESPEEQPTIDLAFLLFDTALQTSGFNQEDPESFAERVYRTMAASLNIHSMDLEDEIEIDDDEEETSDNEEIKLDDASEGHDEF